MFDVNMRQPAYSFLDLAPAATVSALLVIPAFIYATTSWSLSGNKPSTADLTRIPIRCSKYNDSPRSCVPEVTKISRNCWVQTQ